MALVRMALTNYRCFAERQEIELRPVTVVLGRNNSGKSALVRAPLIISTGIDMGNEFIPTSSRTSPLDLDRFPELVGNFVDLLHGHRPHSHLGVELECADPQKQLLSLRATIQNIDEYHQQLVDSFDLQTGERRARLTWVPTDPPSRNPTYVIELDQQPSRRSAVAFRGLIPSFLDENAIRFFDPNSHLFVSRGGEPDRIDFSWELNSLAFRRSFGRVRYLGPFRDRPERLFRLPSRTPQNVGDRGGDTPAIIADDAVRNQRQLTRQINEAMADHLPGWTIDVVDRGGICELVLKSRTDPTLAVNMADAGTGLAQALPIFTQRALDIVNKPDMPTLEIVEQPELHLHPAAHAILADLYLKAAAETKVRFLIETHSETFLLRLRRRIAESRDPSQVAIYYVEQRNGVSTTRRIQIDERGNLDYWPDGVFSEDYEETRALVRAQFAGSDDHES